MLVKFKLHGGHVPYFISTVLFGCTEIAGEYIGEVDPNAGYIPKTLLPATEADLQTFEALYNENLHTNIDPILC